MEEVLNYLIEYGKNFSAIEESLHTIKEKMQAIEERVQNIEERVQNIEERVQTIEEKVHKIEIRIEEMEKKFDKKLDELEKRIYVNVDKKLEELEKRIYVNVDKKIEELEIRMDAKMEIKIESKNNIQTREIADEIRNIMDYFEKKHRDSSKKIIKLSKIFEENRLEHEIYNTRIYKMECRQSNLESRIQNLEKIQKF